MSARTCMGRSLLGPGEESARTWGGISHLTAFLTSKIGYHFINTDFVTLLLPHIPLKTHDFFPPPHHIKGFHSYILLYNSAICFIFDVIYTISLSILCSPGSETFGSIDKLIDSEGNDYDTLPPKKELR